MVHCRHIDTAKLQSRRLNIFHPPHALSLSHTHTHTHRVTKHRHDHACGQTRFKSDTYPSPCGMHALSLSLFSSPALRTGPSSLQADPPSPQRPYMRQGTMQKCRQGNTGQHTRHGRTTHACNAHLQRSPGLLLALTWSCSVGLRVANHSPPPETITALGAFHTLGAVPELPRRHPTPRRATRSRDCCRYMSGLPTRLIYRI